MTLPTSGSISIGAINTELGLSAVAASSLDQTNFRTLAGIPSGTISLSDFRGKSNRTYATWNPSDKDSSVSLSGGNLTATLGAGTSGSVRSTTGVSSGKWYWELYWSSGNSYMQMGIANASFNIANALYDGNPYTCLYQNNYYAFNATPTSVTATHFYPGDTLGFALDATARTFSGYRNNTLIGTMTVLPTGAIYAALGGYGSLSRAVVANFGASAFTYSPPSGYNAGLYS